jgi:type III restriction enzyme
MEAADVPAKREVAVRWCCQALEYAASYNGKPWGYALILHDVIAESIILDGLASQFVVRSKSKK